MDELKAYLKEKGIRIHGQEFVGKVIRLSMKDTAVVEWERIVKVPKYERAYRTKSRVFAHVPPFLEVKPGDTVKIAETRKLSKAKSFIVTEVLKRG